VPSLKWHNPLDVVLKDWAVTDILSTHTSLPFNINSSNISENTNGGYYTLRADTVPGVPQWIYTKYLPGTNEPVPGGKYVNPAAFTNPPVNAAQGDLPRNSLRGFGFTQLDLSIHRVFPIWNALHLEFRAEFFNIFNHPNFANPDLGPGANTVGYPSPGTPGFPLGFGESQESFGSGLGGGSNIGGFNPLFQQGGPRAVQLALRLEF
jgi:hypothetical protein